MRLVLLFLFTVSLHSIFAASGDKTLVQAHDDVDLRWQGAAPWYGRHDVMTTFPDDSKNYQNVTMTFELGCANNGVCSHWDYDLDIYIGEPLGTYDSSVVSLDTLSLMPLEVDTTWDVFEEIEWYEMGRMVTPYATYMDQSQEGFDNTWTSTFTFDVTDYEPLLHGEKPVRVHFHGWQDGYRASVQFEFTEGQPTRDVISIQNIYHGGGYTDFAQFDAAYTPELNIDIPEDAEEARMKFIVTGHGQDGEFTPINYQVLSNSTLVREEAIWRDDCGLLALSPQGGTWIFNRANWCPGDAVEVHDFELTDYIQGSGSNKTLNIDVNFDSYSPAAGAANYSIAGQLILYKPFRRQLDVVLDEIIAPNTDDNYTRFNPVCDNPVVRITNYGSRTLTYCEIEYWVADNNKRYYDWTGSLEIGESEVVALPQMDWGGIDLSNLTFHAKVNWPNNLVDQFAYNNELERPFEIPVIYDNNNFVVQFRANNRPSENSYVIRDAAGTAVVEVNSFVANTINEEVFNLNDGCYTFEFNDYDPQFEGGDGIDWWFNTQQGLESSGWLRLRDGSNNLLQDFNPDFGSQIRHAFLVNNNLDELPSLSNSLPSSHPDVETYTTPSGTEYFVVNDTVYINENSLFISYEDNPVGIHDINNEVHVTVFPNPASTVLKVYVERLQKEQVELSLNNLLGETVKQWTINSNENSALAIDNISHGIYLLNVELGNKTVTKKVIISK